MTAREKFEARLKELGLDMEYETTRDKVGKVMEDGTIVVLVHYSWEPHDPYTELHYPSFDELWESDKFKKECMDNFFEHNDDKFVADLARWLQYGSACRYQCPLFPVDVYFAAEGLELSCKTYKDDPEIKLCGRTWQEVAGLFEPGEDDWKVGEFAEGTLWMNNVDGNMVLVKPDRNFLICAI